MRQRYYNLPAILIRLCRQTLCLEIMPTDSKSFSKIRLYIFILRTGTLEIDEYCVYIFRLSLSFIWLKAILYPDYLIFLINLYLIFTGRFWSSWTSRTPRTWWSTSEYCAIYFIALGSIPFLTVIFLQIILYIWCEFITCAFLNTHMIKIHIFIAVRNLWLRMNYKQIFNLCDFF